MHLQFIAKELPALAQQPATDATSVAAVEEGQLQQPAAFAAFCRRALLQCIRLDAPELLPSLLHLHLLAEVQRSPQNPVASSCHFVLTGQFLQFGLTGANHCSSSHSSNPASVPRGCVQLMTCPSCCRRSRQWRQRRPPGVACAADCRPPLRCRG